MTKTRKPRRSVSEILAEQEAKVYAIRERAAMETAKNNPVLAPIIALIDEQNTTLAESSKLLGNGPQSCNTRRTSHELWIREIDAQENAANIKARYAKTLKESLRNALTEFTTTLASGKKVSEKQVSDILANVEKLDGAEEKARAQKAIDDAQSARVAATQAKKLPKRASKGE